MTWSDLLSFPGLTASAIVTAVLCGIGLIIRNIVEKSIESRMHHHLESKLEVLKSDLSSNKKQIEDLRNGVMSIRAQRQSEIDRRKLVAIDQLWSAVKALAYLKATCATMATIRWPKIAELSQENPKVGEVFSAMAGNRSMELPNTDEHASRPYVFPMAWGLFNAYRLTLQFSHLQMSIIRTAMPADAMNGAESLIPILVTALPDWKDRIHSSGQSIFPQVVEELEIRMLEELRRNLEGVEDDQAQLDRAALIARLAAEREMSANQEKAERSFGARVS